MLYNIFNMPAGNSHIQFRLFVAFYDCSTQ